MASTNKTAYLKLPQWIDTDQPTWLGDVNEAMQLIDDGTKAVANQAANAVATATNALQVANSLTEAVNKAQTTANNAYSAATQAQRDVSSLQNTVSALQTTVTNLNNTVVAIPKTIDSSWVDYEGGLTMNVPGFEVHEGNIEVHYNKYLRLLTLDLYLLTEKFTTDVTLPANTVLATLPSNLRPGKTVAITDVHYMYLDSDVAFGNTSNFFNMNFNLNADGTVTTRSAKTFAANHALSFIPTRGVMPVKGFGGAYNA